MIGLISLKFKAASSLHKLETSGYLCLSKQDSTAHTWRMDWDLHMYVHTYTRTHTHTDSRYGNPRTNHPAQETCSLSEQDCVLLKIKLCVGVLVFWNRVSFFPASHVPWLHAIMWYSGLSNLLEPQAFFRQPISICIIKIRSFLCRWQLHIIWLHV